MVRTVVTLDGEVVKDDTFIAAGATDTIEQTMVFTVLGQEVEIVVKNTFDPPLAPVSE